MGRAFLTSLATALLLGAIGIVVQNVFGGPAIPTAVALADGEPSAWGTALRLVIWLLLGTLMGLLVLRVVVASALLAQLDYAPLSYLAQVLLLPVVRRTAGGITAGVIVGTHLASAAGLPTIDGTAATLANRPASIMRVRQTTDQDRERLIPLLVDPPHLTAPMAGINGATGTPRGTTAAPHAVVSPQHLSRRQHSQPLAHRLLRQQRSLASGAFMYTVQPGDSLSQIAGRFYGNLQDYPRIFWANQGRLQHDGLRLTNPVVIRPGWQVRVPLPSPIITLDTKQNIRYVVQPGDCLDTIAAGLLGDWRRYTAILALNLDQPQADGARLHDPNVLHPGWILRLPAEPGQVSPPRVPRRRPRTVPLSALPPASLPAQPQTSHSPIAMAHHGPTLTQRVQRARARIRGRSGTAVLQAHSAKPLATAIGQRATPEHHGQERPTHRVLPLPQGPISANALPGRGQVSDQPLSPSRHSLAPALPPGAGDQGRRTPRLQPTVQMPDGRFLPTGALATFLGLLALLAWRRRKRVGGLVTRWVLATAPIRSRGGVRFVRGIPGRLSALLAGRLRGDEGDRLAATLSTLFALWADQGWAEPQIAEAREEGTTISIALVADPSAVADLPLVTARVAQRLGADRCTMQPTRSGALLTLWGVPALLRAANPPTDPAQSPLAAAWGPAGAAHPVPLLVPVGALRADQVVHVNLASLPSLLIAAGPLGDTGPHLLSLVTYLSAQARPEQVRLLIGGDPAGDLLLLRDLPHLASPLVDSADHTALSGLLDEAEAAMIGHLMVRHQPADPQGPDTGVTTVLVIEDVAPLLDDPLILARFDTLCRTAGQSSLVVIAGTNDAARLAGPAGQGIVSAFGGCLASRLDDPATSRVYFGGEGAEYLAAGMLLWARRGQTPETLHPFPLQRSDIQDIMRAVTAVYHAAPAQLHALASDDPDELLDVDLRDESVDPYVQTADATDATSDTDASSRREGAATMAEILADAVAEGGIDTGSSAQTARVAPAGVASLQTAGGEHEKKVQDQPADHTATGPEPDASTDRRATSSGMIDQEGATAFSPVDLLSSDQTVSGTIAANQQSADMTAIRQTNVAPDTVPGSVWGTVSTDEAAAETGSGSFGVSASGRTPSMPGDRASAKTSTQDPLLVMHLLGGLDIAVAGRTIHAGQGGLAPTLQEFFAYLALQRGKPQRREEIQLAFWPEATSERGKGNFHARRYKLRDFLASLPDLPDPTTLLGEQDGTYWLDATGVWVDALAFEDLLGRAESAGDALDQHTLREAALAHTGDLFGGHIPPWAEELAQDVRDRYLDAAIKVCKGYARAGEWPSALRWATRLTREEPLAEVYYRLLMRLQKDSGDVAAVERTYERLRVQLHKELGEQTEPEGRTRALLARLTTTDEHEVPEPPTQARPSPTQGVARPRVS